MSTSKVVIVEYHYQEAFKVPKGMDLEDKTVVQEWWVKWNKLKILLVDGTLLEIQPEWDNVGDSMKRPSEEPTIENADEFGLEDDEEEEDNCVGCGTVKVSDIVLNFNGEASCGKCFMNTETVVTGIVCRKCDKELPPHTMAEHFDVTNKILECPHVVE